jgi:hypothetical protein
MMMPNMCYFEFLPMDVVLSGGDASKSAEVGHEYELVITTYVRLNGTTSMTCFRSRRSTTLHSL